MPEEDSRSKHILQWRYCIAMKYQFNQSINQSINQLYIQIQIQIVFIATITKTDEI